VREGHKIPRTDRDLKWNKCTGLMLPRFRHAIVGFRTVKDYRFQGVHGLFLAAVLGATSRFFDELARGKSMRIPKFVPMLRRAANGYHQRV